MGIESFSDPVFDAVKAWLDAEWTHTPIQYPLEEYVPDGAETWLKFEMHGTVYGQQSIGANAQADNRWDDAGLLWFYLVVPRGSGALSYSAIRGAAKELADLFRGKTMLNGTLEFGDAKIDPGAWNDEAGASFVVPISIEWRHWDA